MDDYVETDYGQEDYEEWGTRRNTISVIVAAVLRTSHIVAKYALVILQCQWRKLETLKMGTLRLT